MIDLVEGELSEVDSIDVGSVRRVACNAPDVVYPSDVTPPVGFPLFQIARFRPDGLYTDGAEPELVGDRTIVGGDCP
jgi:hypothetical protein